jgi:hypothetical protein
MQASHAPSTQDEFLDIQNLRLKSLAGYVSGAFTDAVWVFKETGRGGQFPLDFSLFDNVNCLFTDSVKADFSGNLIYLKPSQLAKLLFLNGAYNRSSTATFKPTFALLLRLFFFFKQEGLKAIESKEHLKRYFEFSLIHDVGEEGVERRFSIGSYHRTFGVCSIARMKEVLRLYRINAVVGRVTEEQAKKVLFRCVSDSTGMSKSEYLQGGSFNFLGLEVGKHYIDHCQNLLEENIAIASALRKTMNLVFGSSRHAEQLNLSEQGLKNYFHAIINGDSYRRKGNKKEQQISRVTEYWFRKFHQEESARWIKVSTKLLNEIVRRSGLEERFDSLEFVRTIINYELIPNPPKTREAIWDEYIATLSDRPSQLPDTLNDFLDLVADVVEENINPLPEKQEELFELIKNTIGRHTYDVAGESSDLGYGGASYGVHFFSYVAMLCFVALTGWRASEYGFSLSSLHIEQNADPVDNYYSAFRFYLKWKVPKTGGETRVKREITLSCFLLLKQISAVTSAAMDTPLFISHDASASALNKVAPKINHIVSQSVSRPWNDFCQNYVLFKSADEEITSVNESVIQVRDKVRREAELVNIFGHGPARDKFFSLVESYLSGTASEEDIKHVELTVPQHILHELKEGDFDIGRDIKTTIRNIVLKDVAYPTPHAFRHIWAEAVYLRYQGDVGAMVRANFKHVNRSFFMAYLQSKAMETVSGMAKYSALNSVVLSALKDDPETKRGIGLFARRAAEITHVKTHEEQIKLVERICDERIVSYQFGPIGACIARRGTERSAKCAEHGQLNPHNAKSSFCLNCVNFEPSDDYHGILIMTQDHLSALMNDSLPVAFKGESIKAIRGAVKQFRRLKSPKKSFEYRNACDAAIKKYEAAIAVYETQKQKDS